MSRRVQYARFVVRNAWMSQEFGVSYATKLFGAEAVASLPRISRGKRKGLIKGILVWKKCDVGGWAHSYIGGYVQYPGFVDAHIEVDGVVVLHTTSPSYEHKVKIDQEEEARREEIAKRDLEFA